MAGIDYSIPGQIKGIQLESPMNAMAQAMQLRGLQEASQMNALKTQEYARKAREDQELAAQQNELAKIHSSDIKIGSPEYFNLVAAKAPRLLESVQERALKRSELDEKIEERKFKNFGRKFDLYKSFVPTINSIDGVTQFVSAAYKDPDLAPILNQIRPYEEALNTNQDEFNRDPENWKLNAAGVSPEKIIEIARNRAEDTRKQTEFEQKQGDRTAPKPEKFELGGKIITIDMNPQSPTYNTQLREDAKTAAPAPLTESNLARLQRERAALVAADKNDPRIKQIDEAIGKETGTTMTAEQKSQAQDRDARRVLERERLNLDRYKASKGDGSGRGPGPGTKLEKGEIWNEAEQRIETVPGSKLNIAQSNAHGKDRSSLVAVETKTKSAIAKIDEILDPKNQDGFDANFSGMVPYGGFVTGRFAPDSRRKIESLKADMKSAGLELIRQGGSIGQITEREWPILEAMIAGISPEMTPEAARAEFKKVRAYMNRLKDNAKDAYQTEWGDTQYFKPAPGDKTPRAMSAQDKQALDWATANPKDPRSAQIKQRLGVK
jgi:hypothetical protein